MNKINKLLKEITRLSCSLPENPAVLTEYFSKSLVNNQAVTFFSWKMPKVRIISNKLIINFNFDRSEADKYINNEKIFLDLITKNNLVFNYVKIIPDDLFFQFWRFDNKKSVSFYSQQVSSYFRNICPKTSVITFTDFLKYRNIRRLYSQTYETIFNSFDVDYLSPIVDPRKFDKEILLRSTYYTTFPLPFSDAKNLARKAFSVFAAESATLYQISKQNILPNLILLAGSRSIDTYKYEFYKLPKNRFVLPKLFVL